MQTHWGPSVLYFLLNFQEALYRYTVFTQMQDDPNLRRPPKKTQWPTENVFILT
jgi:hypothetical protein